MPEDPPAEPDPTKLVWTLADIAGHWRLPLKTVRTYRERTRRGEGRYLPDEDDTIGRTPVWYPQTIIGFQRPGQGARRDLQQPADSSPSPADRPEDRP